MPAIRRHSINLLGLLSPAPVLIPAAIIPGRIVVWTVVIITAIAFVAAMISTFNDNGRRAHLNSGVRPVIMRIVAVVAVVAMPWTSKGTGAHTSRHN